VVAGARALVLRRCRGACERCGLEWPWELYLFRIDPGSRAWAANLRALCGRCSESETGDFAPLIAEPSLRERMRAANNRRTGATRLTPARRHMLIERRGARCELCGVSGAERQLDVHHRVAILRGGDDSEPNLLVLCFTCHHQLQPCALGCGRYARRPNPMCRRCSMRRRLEELYPASTWDEIKTRMPSLARAWPPGYEPRGSNR
jgi:hypothetical protein